MNRFRQIIFLISEGFKNDAFSGTAVASVLIVSVVIGFYEFCVYRVVSHRAFYNKSFHISLVALPPIIATIIMCLQSNSIITLGTIGALAIIRYRTAVKDPVDMIYMLWSVHTGITCGCQLYKVSALTSVVITLVLIVLNFVMPVFAGKKGEFTLVAYIDKSKENELISAVKAHSGRHRVKSRSFTQSGLCIVIELTSRDPAALTDAVNGLDSIEKFSLVEYDSEDII